MGGGIMIYRIIKRCTMKKKRMILVGSILIALLFITVGVTYAFYTYRGQGQRENTVKTGELSFVYDEQRQEGNQVSLTNAFPMTDEQGKGQVGNNSVFEFIITATTKGAPISYEIYLTKEESSTLSEQVVKTYLTKVTDNSETAVVDTRNQREINLYSELGDTTLVSQGKTLYQETIPESQTSYHQTFRYRMWIDEDASQMQNGEWIYNGQSFSVKVNVYASNEEMRAPLEEVLVYEDTTTANVPELAEGMIPVVYSITKHAWVKQDLEKSYAYQEQVWANAVTVVENGTNTREYYQSAPAETVIPMEDINTMWVWIPRYEYKYTNLGTQYAGGTKEQPGEISINFISKETTSPSSSEYKVHPAFTFGGMELSGIWVGKFETTGTLPRQDYCRDESCNVSTVTIKPGVTSLRNQQVASLFYMTRSMQTNNASTYGFASDNSYNIHMAKNSEWGAVAYLSQSRYGKYGNPDYEGVNKEIYQNKSSSFITGSSNGTPSTESTNPQVSYDTPYSGYGASTTGTIYGIYDMSGGSWEYVMGNYNRYSGYTARSYTVEEAEKILGRTDHISVGIWNSGFNGPVYGKDSDGSEMSWTTGVEFPEEKYFDLYTTSNGTTACNGACDGHALTETAGWYNDAPWIVTASSPWFGRGGSWSSATSAGVFYSSSAYGNASGIYASRAVLAQGA